MIVIRQNEDASLDEIVTKNCDIHLEQMSSRYWWMSIKDSEGNVYHVDFGSRCKIVAGVEKVSSDLATAVPDAKNSAGYIEENRRG